MKAKTIFIISGALVLTGAGIKLAHVPYGDLTIIAGMALGLIGLNIYINEIKKEQ